MTKDELMRKIFKEGEEFNKSIGGSASAPYDELTEDDKQIIGFFADFILTNYIPKSSAVDYVKVCVHCFGGYRSDVGPEPCIACNDKGIIPITTKEK